MSNNEEKIRELFDIALNCGFSPGDVKAHRLSIGRTVPVLTEAECQNIATNYPYSWEAIKAGFGIKQCQN